MFWSESFRSPLFCLPTCSRFFISENLNHSNLLQMLCFYPEWKIASDKLWAALNYQTQIRGLLTCFVSLEAGCCVVSSVHITGLCGDSHADTGMCHLWSWSRVQTQRGPDKHMVITLCCCSSNLQLQHRDHVCSSGDISTTTDPFIRTGFHSCPERCRLQATCSMWMGDRQRWGCRPSHRSAPCGGGGLPTTSVWGWSGDAWRKRPDRRTRSRPSRRRTRPLAPSRRVCAAWRPQREGEEAVRERRSGGVLLLQLRVKSQRVTGSRAQAAARGLPVLMETRSSRPFPSERMNVCLYI